MEKITLQEVLDKHLSNMINESKDSYITLGEMKDQIEYQVVLNSLKEVWNLAVDKCAENAEAIEGWNTGYSGSAASIDKDSILQVKEMIK
jgi:hypothetical protein